MGMLRLSPLSIHFSLGPILQANTNTQVTLWRLGSRAIQYIEVIAHL